MKPLSIFAVLFLVVGLPCAADENKSDPSKDPYAEFFSVPDKVALDEKQKEKLSELRKTHEPQLAQLDKAMTAPGGSIDTMFYREKLARALARKRNLVLTEEQRAVLGVKIGTPFIAEEKSLNDDKVWELTQLEKVFTIQSRSYDIEENEISFMVITKRKWTNDEKQSDDLNWSVETVKAVFYDKNDEVLFTFMPRHRQSPRGTNFVGGGLSRTPTKLTDKEEEAGLLRFRIKLDLDHWQAHGAKGKDTVGSVKSVKLVCPGHKP